MTTSSHVQQIAETIRAERSPTAAWQKIVAWAKAQPKFAKNDWAEVESADMAQDLAAIAEWFVSGLGELLEDDAVNLVWVSLGDCPEIFALGGGNLTANASMKEAIGLVSQIGEFSYDEAYELIDEESETYPASHEVTELSAPFWQHFPDCDREEDSPVDMEAGYVLWLGAASIAIADALRSNEAKINELAGSRPQIAFLAHFEDAAYGLGSLNNGKWSPPGS